MLDQTHNLEANIVVALYISKRIPQHNASNFCIQQGYKINCISESQNFYKYIQQVPRGLTRTKTETFKVSDNLYISVFRI